MEEKDSMKQQTEACEKQCESEGVMSEGDKRQDEEGKGNPEEENQEVSQENLEGSQEIFMESQNAEKPAEAADTAEADSAEGKDTQETASSEEEKETEEGKEKAHSFLEKAKFWKKPEPEPEEEEDPYEEIEVLSDAEKKERFAGEGKYQYQGLSDAEVENQIHMGRVNRTGEDGFKSTKDIVKTHTLTYFNFLNIFLAVLVLISGQIKNITFMFVILVNTLIGIVQELKVKKLVDKLAVITASKTRVIRNGVGQEIDIQDVVLKDTMLVYTGDQICADGIVLESDGIEVNESMLTGESKPVKKYPGDTIMSGSFMTAGNGVVQVTHVGDDNYAVQLVKKAKIKKRASSEMQHTIRRIIKVLGVLIIPIGIMLYFSQQASGNNFSDSLVNTVAGVIGMIPEGLVLLTSISFILGVGRLARKRALVQEMEAIEALARVNVLCLDKTGTITTGKLEVVEVKGLNGTASEEITTAMNEIAFAFDDINNTQEALMQYFKRTGRWTIREKIPFSSDRKYRAIRFESKGCFVLGAPDFLLGEDDKEIYEQIEAYSMEGLRVLLLASCEEIYPGDGTVTGVKPMGLIVISDCIRPEAPAIFEYFRKQNVNIKVVSGDNPMTVSQIAGKAGLEGAENYIDANNLPEDFEELKAVIGDYTVFGRVKPEQKQNIIKAYQANKNVVGMVGDGVNDVLALKDSDCGIAMAAGSDAAKQVAHIVLLDSDFACLKNIVSEGRTIITNIERVSSLYLTKTIYSVILCVLFILLQRDYPFIPIQLSWISAMAIGVPSFILTLEKNESVNSHGFLMHVLKVALPSALTMVLTMLTIQAMVPFWDNDGLMTYTFNLLVGGAVSMMVVIKVCTPMNWMRCILSLSVIIIFVGGIVLAPGLLGIYSIFRWEMILVIPMICMVLVLENLFTRMVLEGYRLRDWIVKKIKGLKKKNEEAGWE